MQLEANFQKAANFIRAAARQQAQLAVLPEYHLTNWLPDDPNFIPLCAQYKSYLTAYQALAKELNICIVPGTMRCEVSHASSPRMRFSDNVLRLSMQPARSRSERPT